MKFIGYILIVNVLLILNTATAKAAEAPKPMITMAYGTPRFAPCMPRYIVHIYEDGRYEYTNLTFNETTKVVKYKKTKGKISAQRFNTLLNVFYDNNFMNIHNYIGRIGSLAHYRMASYEVQRKAIYFRQGNHENTVFRDGDNLKLFEQAISDATGFKYILPFQDIGCSH
jgi:hypothetical protein